MVVYAGWKTKVRTSTTSLDSLTGSSITGPIVEGIQTISVDSNLGNISIGEVGTKFISAIVDGKVGMSGVINRFYTGSGYFNLTGITSTGSSSDLYMCIYPGGDVSGQPYIAFSGLKFSNVSQQVGLGATPMSEKITYIAKRIYMGSL